MNTKPDDLRDRAFAECSKSSLSLVERIIEQEGHGLHASKNVQVALSDVALAYLQLLLEESDAISELKNGRNITTEHVRLAVLSLEARRNLINDEEVAHLTEGLKPIKSHVLNSDESKLTSVGKSQNAGKRAAPPIQAPGHSEGALDPR